MERKEFIVGKEDSLVLNARFAIGSIYADNNQYEKAHQVYDEVLQIVETDIDRHKMTYVTVNTLRGVAFRAQGEKEKALAVYL